MKKHTFMVGRTTGAMSGGRRSTLVVFVSVMRSPIAGPWTVRAVVSTN
jgi:hypothetical protein